ncbi:MAG TPA: response regulator, partial [Spirochaetota bacterium]|nr:response regulator [Spirochaetota bacterium]
MTKPINLLIADDDRFIRRSIIRMLGREDIFRIYEAESRDSVLDSLNETKIDCVLMDYYMSDITGLELMQIFREKAISVPVIMLTGQGDEQLAANIMKAGAFDYIPKSRLAEQDFAMTLTGMVNNAVSRQEEIEEADRAKIALELSEARYRGLIENSPILIVRFFPEEYMISFLNDQFCTYFGVQRFSVLGENILHLIPESNHEMFRARVNAISKNNPVARIELTTLSNNEEKWQLWVVQ